MSLLVILFWVSLALVFYIYAGYPLCIGLLARCFPRETRKEPNKLTATVIISIYNERSGLSDKLRNLLSIAESDRIVQILIGSDGSTDHPESVIEAFNDSRLQLASFPGRRGKPSVLNDLIPQATGDILIMMDVRQRLDNHVIPALMDNFSDSTVGVVSGELIFERLEGDTSVAGGIDAYWRYEKWLRDHEGRVHSVPGATGALYAIRRELAKPIPTEAALDDVLIPMLAIAQGYRCIFEPAAIIYDRPAQSTDREAIRKRRTLAGCVQLLKYYPKWVLPFGHPIWWQYGSHKISRLFSPWLLFLTYLSSALLVQQSFFLMMLILQTGCYVLGIAGTKIKNTPRPLAWMGFFLAMQATLLRAWLDGITRRNLALWNRA
ncbi:MAG TPA: glycosyltransferase family 2 protein [Kiritimatiellia bacterium]|nr:glycosyltransferase family 2 protein [Kiritimatiellia bacterium]